MTYQRDSTVQRKDLAQKTKDFRKLDDATKLTEVKGLLKGSDKIIMHSAESANFFSLPNIYRSLDESLEGRQLGLSTSLLINF